MTLRPSLTPLAAPPLRLSPPAYPPLRYLMVVREGGAQKGGSVLVRSSLPRRPCLVVRRYQKPSAAMHTLADLASSWAVSFCTIPPRKQIPTYRGDFLLFLASFRFSPRSFPEELAKLLILGARRGQFQRERKTISLVL